MTFVRAIFRARSETARVPSHFNLPLPGIYCALSAQVEYGVLTCLVLLRQLIGAGIAQLVQ